MGVERMPGESFHWTGEYGYDLNDARTIETKLNVFSEFRPTLPDKFRDASTVFLANIDPDLQIHVLKQMRSVRIKALDSMNYWIKEKNSSLKKAISMADILLLNDAEIRSLTGEHNIVKAAKAAHRLGARIVVIKRGEYGALLCYDNEVSFIPAYPLEDVFDPTGAGDTFAGGFLSSLHLSKEISVSSLKSAMAMGAVMSSFVIEKFSFDRLLELSEQDITDRKQKLLKIISF
jgi:sugar/nucleoside kinase (ribokinase family)